MFKAPEMWVSLNSPISYQRRTTFSVFKRKGITSAGIRSIDSDPPPVFWKNPLIYQAFA
jgi:hypothetical protein